MAWQGRQSRTEQYGITLLREMPRINVEGKLLSPRTLNRPLACYANNPRKDCIADIGAISKRPVSRSAGIFPVDGLFHLRWVREETPLSDDPVNEIFPTKKSSGQQYANGWSPTPYTYLAASAT